MLRPSLNSTHQKSKVMIRSNAVVAIYKAHSGAESAIKELQHSGFDLRKLSIIGRDYHTEEHVVGYYNAGDRIKFWGQTGAFWGGIWGLLFGSAFLLIPGIGPLVFAGPLVGSIVGALEGAVALGGLSALGAALYSVGIPKDSIVHYESVLRTGRFLLIVHGTAEDTAQARDILDRTRPETMQAYLPALARPEMIPLGV